MLSRSAERIYWLARYLERTENSARLINVYMNLLMDLPKSVEMGWDQLLRINGCEDSFYRNYHNASERNVAKFLLNDRENLCSLFSSICQARENIRTTRELLPDEAWEQVNELYLFANNNLNTISNRSGRVFFLETILEGCQRFTGLLSGYMNHNYAYQFIRLGRNIERADMSSRILELAALLLSESRSQEMRQYESILWMNILKTLNALLMYRQQVKSRIKGDDVLTFLLTDESLPRSVTCCLNDIIDAIEKMPNFDRLPIRVRTLRAEIQDIAASDITQVKLRENLDIVQKELAKLHNAIADQWFLAQAGQSQQQ